MLSTWFGRFAGTWQHLAFTIDSTGHAVIYINGAQSASGIFNSQTGGPSPVILTQGTLQSFNIG